MSIYDKFFEGELHLIPSNNEFLNLSKYSYLNSQLENQYSDIQRDLQKNSTKVFKFNPKKRLEAYMINV